VCRLRSWAQCKPILLYCSLNQLGLYRRVGRECGIRVEILLRMWIPVGDCRAGLQHPGGMFRVRLGLRLPQGQVRLGSVDVGLQGARRRGIRGD